MKKSLFFASLLALLAAGCSTTEINEPMGLNAPFPELENMTADGSEVDLEGNTQGDQLSQTALDELAASGELADRSVYFDYDSYVIKSDFEGLIGNHAAFINKHNAGVVIYGNADYRGSHEYNLALGQKRAVAVKQALEVLGVDMSSIETVSFGEEHANQECTGSTCGQDRRADIGYVGE
jgi:peptidoglycan-associated lipoprotein